MNPILTQLANGRRIAARSLIMGSMTASDSIIYRKSLIASPDEVDRHTDSWGGIGATTDQDDHAYEYTRLGKAKVMQDKFTGGAMLDNRDMVNPDDSSLIMLIEPYDEELPEDERAITIPDWEPKEGDLVAVLLRAGIAWWLEVVGITGQTLMADNGKRYLLNARDEMTYMEPFATEFEERDA